jgi:hypothetical protein
MAWASEGALMIDLGRLLQKIDPRSEIEPVENILNKGTFDSFVMLRGCPLWIEAKRGGPNQRPAMRPGQSGFAHRMVRSGCRAWVLMGHPDKTVRLIDGRTIGEDWRDWLAYRGPLSPHLTDHLMKRQEA